jgi:hypothetical protein
MPLELRLPGESDEAFRSRADRAARYAQILVEAALANRDIQELIACPDFPFYTEESERRSPTVRVEYEQAIAIGGIGECLQATQSKSWGKGPYIRPLGPDDPLCCQCGSPTFSKKARSRTAVSTSGGSSSNCSATPPLRLNCPQGQYRFGLALPPVSRPIWHRNCL